MKQFLVIACTILSSQLFSQTKLIAHKSHSGTAGTFNISLTEEFFCDPGSNFGVYPERRVVAARLDSLIFLSDTISVMVTSKAMLNTWKDSVTVWKPGRDTLINHPLLSRRSGIENIRRSIKYDYNFRNPVDSVKIISYDAIEKLKYIDYEAPGKRNAVPVLIESEHNQKPPFDGGIIICLIAGGVVSVLTGISYYNYRQLKSKLSISRQS